eukprot:4983696-Pyramimonas_sp.AAC.1
MARPIASRATGRATNGPPHRRATGRENGPPPKTTLLMEGVDGAVGTNGARKDFIGREPVATKPNRGTFETKT